MLKHTLTYDDWTFIFEKAKALKSSIILVGVRGVLIGFDESLSILRTIEIPLEYAITPFSFMVKDLKPFYDHADSKPDIRISRNYIEIGTEQVNEWIFGDAYEEVYPTIPIVTDPFQLKYLFDLYNNMMNNIMIYPVTQDMGNMTKSDIIQQYSALKADSGNLIFKNGNHTLVMFYGWFKMNKSDEVDIRFYDIPGTTNFITRVDVVKPKTKECVSTYTMNFNVISTVPF